VGLNTITPELDIYVFIITLINIIEVIVSVLDLSVVIRGFESRSSQFKDYKICVHLAHRNLRLYYHEGLLGWESK
jgi:hypothetical protein